VSIQISSFHFQTIFVSNFHFTRKGLTKEASSVIFKVKLINMKIINILEISIAYNVESI